MPGIVGMGMPQDIKSPIPQDDLESAIASQGSVAGKALQPMVSAAQAPPAPAAEPSLDDLASQFMQQQSAQPAEDLSLDDLAGQFMNEQTQSGLWRPLAAASPEQEAEAEQMQKQSNEDTGIVPFLKSIGQQIGEAPVRAKASYAVTDKEKRNVLEQTYGPEGVKKAKGGFLVKRDGKWTKFDNDNFELIGDVLDWSREALEGSIAVGGTALGTAVMPGAGTIAGGAAGGAAGKLAADTAAQQLMGIEQDPERSKATEYAWATGGGAVGGALEAYMAKRMAAKAAQQQIEKLTPKAQQAEKAVQDVKDGIQEIKNILGKNVQVPSNIQQPMSADLQAEAKMMASTKEGQAITEQLGGDITDAFKKVVGGYANMSSKSTNAGSQFQDVASFVREVEGKLIETHRNEAIRLGQNKLLPVSNTGRVISNIGEDIGITVTNKGLNVPSQEALEATGISPQGAKILRGLVNSEGKEVRSVVDQVYNAKDGIEMHKMMGLYNRIKGLAENVSKNSQIDQKTKSIIYSLRKAIATDVTEGIGSVLETSGSVSAKPYAESLKRFSQVASASDDLVKILDKETLGADALSKYLFKSGEATINEIQAVKRIIAPEHPEVWENIVGNHIHDVIAKNTSTATSSNVANVNWEGVEKGIFGLGTKTVDEMFPPAVQDSMRNLFKLAKQFQARTPAHGEALGVPEGFKQKLLYTLTNLSNYKGLAKNILTGMDKNQRIAQWINDSGVDGIVAGLPKAQQNKVRPVLLEYLNESYERSSEALKKQLPISLPRGTGAAVGTATGDDVSR